MSSAPDWFIQTRAALKHIVLDPEQFILIAAVPEPDGEWTIAVSASIPRSAIMEIFERLGQQMELEEIVSQEMSPGEPS